MPGRWSSLFVSSLVLPKSIQPPQSEAFPAASAQLPRMQVLYIASHSFMTLGATHYRALSNLVVGRGVLDCWVAGVVLVLIGWNMLT